MPRYYRRETEDGSREDRPWRAPRSDPLVVIALRAIAYIPPLCVFASPITSLPTQRLRSPGPRLLSLWRSLSPFPGGAWIFSRLFGRMVPYSGSVRPRIQYLEPGHARVTIPDRRANRQHLGSVHAVALMNLAEMTSGMAMLCGLPQTVRGIVTSMQIEYYKKARGTITAEARVEIPTVVTDVDFEVVAECKDLAGVVVARATIRWRLGPVREETTRGPRTRG
jgi:acyl-coenzyme A thioesterase PaaI-like protein